MALGDILFWFTMPVVVSPRFRMSQDNVFLRAKETAWCFSNNAKTWKYFCPRKNKNQQAVLRIPLQLNKLCAVPVSPGAVQELWVMLWGAWHQLHQNKLLSVVWAAFQPASGVKWASADPFVSPKVGFSDINVLTLWNGVYSKCVLMFLAAASEERGVVFACINVWDLIVERKTSC